MPQTPMTRQLRSVAAVLIAAVTGFSLLQTMVIPVLPTIQRQLDTSQGSVTWVLTAYLLSASVATPILGRLGDMFGKRRVLLLSVSALVVGSALAALADSLALLVVARVIQGLGGGVLPLSFGMMRDAFPRGRVAPLIGLTSAMASAGAGAAILLAGPIVDHVGYAWLFWLPAILMAVILLAAWRIVPESRVRSPGQVNWAAALLLAGWLLCLLLAVSRGSQWGWQSSRVILLLVGAAVTTLAWTSVELRSRVPLIDLHLMRHRPVWTTNVVTLLVGAAQFGTFAFIPQFAETPVSAGYGFGSSVSGSASFLLPSVAMGFVTGVLAGRLTRTFGAKHLLVGGMVVSVVGLLMMAWWHDQEWQFYLASFVFGLGNGTVFCALAALVVAAVADHQTGVAAGMNANIRTIGGATGVAAITSLLTAGVGAGELPSESAYTAGFLLLAVMIAAGTVVALLVPGSLPGVAGRAGERAQEHAGLAIVPGGTLVEPLAAPVDPGVGPGDDADLAHR